MFGENVPVEQPEQVILGKHFDHFNNKFTEI